MIRCEQVSKGYQGQPVITDFSYTFQNTGFYLLFGNSGSGKTTFINLLEGLLCFDEGQIEVDEEVFRDRVDFSRMKEQAEYITQDSFFVDFLTVADNLRLYKDDDEAIRNVLDKFGLREQYGQYPRTLSGGERQRLALARFFLREKKILFLDEPTAALDDDNKNRVFGLLAEIKKNVLVICSSHDRAAFSYADEVIYFEKRHEAGEQPAIHERKHEEPDTHSIVGAYTAQKLPLYYLRQWFRYNNRNKGSRILFTVFMTFAICACMLADTPFHKYTADMQYAVGANMCELRTINEPPQMYEILCAMPRIRAVSLAYGRSIPLFEKEVPEPVPGQVYEAFEIPEYETYAAALPFEADLCRLTSAIKYGAYFDGQYQIILTLEEAKKLNKAHPEELIGQKVNKNLYGVGDTELEIVGIFDEFNVFEKEYLLAAQMQEAKWFVNDMLINTLYIDNQGFHQSDQRGYTLYFDTYRDMMQFYDAYSEEFRNQGHALFMGQNYENAKGTYIFLFAVMMPIAFLVMIFAVLFYVNKLRIVLTYEHQFLSVFDYAGYDVKHIISSFSLLNLSELFKQCLIAVLLAVVLTTGVNILNNRFALVGFQIFTVNAGLLAGFFVLLAVTGILFVNLFLRRIQWNSWYENITANRDIL